MLSVLGTFPQRGFFGLEESSHVVPINDMTLRSRFAKNDWYLDTRIQKLPLHIETGNEQKGYGYVPILPKRECS